MKKKYIVPSAKEESFEADSYIAACSFKTTGTANGMRCVNPYHAHYGQYYFAGVWIEGVTACTTIVNSNSTKSSSNGYLPYQNSVVYGTGTNVYIADTRVNTPRGWYYVPAEVVQTFNKNNTPCYGIYKHDGTAITEKVLS